MGWRVLVGLLAAANVLFGLWALVLPERAAELLGFQLEGAAASGEIRAVYGGLIAASGVVMALALRREDGAHWLRALGLCFFGLVIGRLLSLGFDGLTAWNGLALVLEAASGGLLLHVARRELARPG